MSNYPNCRKDKLVVRETDGEILIYDLKIDKAFCLNKTSALVWRLCDGKTDIPTISKAAEKKLGHPLDDAIVWLAIEELRKDGLLSKGYVFESHFNGLTRRQVLRKFGVLSAISLPIVTSLVAPSASFAQSCVGLGTSIPGQLSTGTDCPLGPPCSCASYAVNCCSGSASIDSCTTMAPGAGVPAGMQRCFCTCD